MSPAAPPRLIVIMADDLTGMAEVSVNAADIGLHGLVFPRAASKIKLTADDRIVFVNLACRALSTEIARRRVSEVLNEIGEQRRIAHAYLKIDSAARGPIGPMIEAMCSALGVSEAPILLANPMTGRVTRDGWLWIGAKLLHESDFRNDLLHPASDSYLPRVLGVDCTAALTLEKEAVPGDQTTTMLRILDATTRGDIAAAGDRWSGCVAAGGAAPFGITLLRHWTGAMEPVSVSSRRRPSFARSLLISGTSHPAVEGLAGEFESMGGHILTSDQWTGDVPAGPVMLRPPRENYDPRKITRAIAHGAVYLLNRVRPEACLIVGGETAQAVIDTIGIERFVALGALGAVAELEVAAGQPHEGMRVMFKPGSYGSPGLLKELFVA